MVQLSGEPVKTWPPYLIPIARMPSLDLPNGDVMRPVLVRVVRGEGLKHAIKNIAPSNAEHMLDLGAVAFGYCPDLYADPDSILIFEPYVLNQGDPAWILRRGVFSSRMEDLHVYGTKTSYMVRTWNERDSLLWLLFDVLGASFGRPDPDEDPQSIFPDTSYAPGVVRFDERVQEKLIIPDVLTDDSWRNAFEGPSSKRLQRAQKRLTEEATKLRHMQDGLTYGKGSEAWDVYVYFYGEPPRSVELNTQITRVIELRKECLFAADNSLISWVRSEQGKPDISTPFPLMRTRLKTPFRSWSIIGSSQNDHMRWTIHRDSEKQGRERRIYLFDEAPHLSEPASGSTEHPLLALKQAGLYIPEHDVDAWLDENLVTGELLYEDEGYRLLGTQPLFLPEGEFKVWARGLERAP